MPIRKTYSDSFSVDGPRDEWLDRCRTALSAAPFTVTECNKKLGRVSASYFRWTAVGDVEVSLHPSDGHTRIDVTVRAGADNIFALFQSPGARILRDFRFRVDSLS